MDIRDVSYLAVLNSKKDVLYAMNCAEIDANALLGSIEVDADPISSYEDAPLFVSNNQNVLVVLLGMPSSNEIFLKSAFDGFMECLEKIVKTWSAERIGEKYDQVVMLMNEFVFRGIILTDDPTELNKRMIKRTFENINGIKVKKGLASFLNRATKSIVGRKY